VTTPDDSIYAVAKQLQIANALELVRIAFDHAWNDDITASVADTLRISIGDIYPARCLNELRGCRCILRQDHEGRHAAIEAGVLIVWPTERPDDYDARRR
jgi:hypothetical protein